MLYWLAKDFVHHCVKPMSLDNHGGDVGNVCVYSDSSF